MDQILELKIMLLAAEDRAEGLSLGLAAADSLLQHRTEMFQSTCAKYEEKIAELHEALRWYVENDDTNEGGKWEESNVSWLRGKRRAMRALGMETEE